MTQKTTKLLGPSAWAWWGILAVVAMPVRGDDPLQWTDSSGKRTIEATFLRIENEKVVLQTRSSASGATEVPLERLSPGSRSQAMQIWYDRQDATQFSKMKDHFDALFDKPEAVTGTMMELHKAFPESPYAGVWAAIGMSAGSNDHKKATVILKDVTRRIEDQRSIDPTRHTMTLVSVLNNQAVCEVKSLRADSAAARLTQAIELTKIVPPVVRQNAEWIAELAIQANSPLSLTDRTRSRMLSALALQQNAGVNTKMQNGWYYALDFDMPNEAGAVAQRVQGLDAPRADVELLSMGTGFVVSPGVVLTSRPVIETTDFSGPKLVTVGHFEQGSFNTLSVSQAYVTSSRRTAQSSVVFGDGELNGPVSRTAGFTLYTYKHPEPGSADAELAALEVPGLSLAPLPVAEDFPDVNAALRLGGYERGPDIISRGIRWDTGHVLQTPDRDLVQTTTNHVRGGNRGGPLLDEQNVVRGIAFDMPDGNSPANGLLFGGRAIRQWFYKHVQTAALSVPARGAVKPNENTVERSIIPVFVWGLKRPSQGELFSEIANSAKVGSGFSLRDGWCLACGGDGAQKCPDTACKNGRKSSIRPIVAGRNHQGQAQTRPGTFYSTCETCSGRGVLPCPHCNRGRLK